MKNIRSYLLLTLVFSVMVLVPLYSQNTTIRLNTAADSASSFQVLNNGDLTRFRLNADGGFYVVGTHATGNIPVIGTGSRFMWYPRRSALRAGYVSSTQWNEGYIGDYSIAMGYGPIASGSSSISLGNGTTASAVYSFAAGFGSAASNTYAVAMGALAEASGNSSVSIGNETVASGIGAVALGYQTNATGAYSTALGRTTTASGQYSTAMGAGAVAQGDCSFAVGSNVEATGNFSFALGKSVSTSGKTGVFIIGDSSYFVTQPHRDNQFVARFKGGYRLYTDNSSNCVYLDSGATSWAHISDSAKKELFAPADDEYILKSLSKLRLGSWNYKNQDPKYYRHYGPMAQEIYRYFGRDKYGTIGNDTTLSTADMDGIMMICLQALEKRTMELKTALDELRTEKDKAAVLNTSFDGLKKEVERIKRDLLKLSESKSAPEDNNITLNK